MSKRLPYTLTNIRLFAAQERRRLEVWADILNDQDVCVVSGQLDYCLTWLRREASSMRALEIFMLGLASDPTMPLEIDGEDLKKKSSDDESEA